MAEHNEIVKVLLSERRLIEMTYNTQIIKFQKRKISEDFFEGIQHMYLMCAGINNDKLQEQGLTHSEIKEILKETESKSL